MSLFSSMSPSVTLLKPASSLTLLLFLNLFAEVQLLQRFSQRGGYLHRQLGHGFIWAARKHTLTRDVPPLRHWWSPTHDL